MGNGPTKQKGKIPTVEVTPSPRTVPEFIIGCINSFGSKVAQVDSATGEKVTFDAILERSAALATGLSARGLRPGEVALIIGENSVHYPWVLLGVLQTGASAHLLDPRSTPREVEHAMSISRPTIALLSSKVSKEAGVTSVLRDSECVRHILEWGGVDGDVQPNLPDGISSLELLLVSPAKSAVSMPCSPRPNPGHEAPKAPPPTPTSLAANYGDSCSPAPPLLDASPVQQMLLRTVDGMPSNAEFGGSSVALILSSSGSTGLPKGVMLTHDNVLAALELGPTFVDADDVMLGVSPYYHAFGGILMLMACCAGAKVVALGRFNMEAMFHTIEEHRVTVMHVVSSLLVSLSKLGQLNEERLKPLQCLRRLWSGAAQVSPLVQVALQNRLPNVRLFHSYGMTETTFTTFWGDVRADKPGSPGRLVPSMECKVIDPESGKTSERGELCFRGPMVMKGYLGNGEATSEALDSEGWLHSGDLGFVDEDGYYYIVDRLKDILKYNGHQVSPSELEALLITHPAVSEAAVIGEPHEYGDAPRALVILAEGATVLADELQTYIAGKVAPHKQLRGGITFVRAFPRTGSGKLQRRKLRALLVGEANESFTSTSSSASSSTAAAESEPNSPDPKAASEEAKDDTFQIEANSAPSRFESTFEEERRETLREMGVDVNQQHRPSVSSLSTIYSVSTPDSSVTSPLSSASIVAAMPPTPEPLTPSRAINLARKLEAASKVPLPATPPTATGDLGSNADFTSPGSCGSAPMDLVSPDSLVSPPISLVSPSSIASASECALAITSSPLVFHSFSASEAETESPGEKNQVTEETNDLKNENV